MESLQLALEAEHGTLRWPEELRTAVFNTAVKLTPAGQSPNAAYAALVEVAGVARETYQCEVCRYGH